MSILVTGGKGYIGKAVIKQLLDDGYTVIEYGRHNQPPYKNPQHIFAMGELYDIPRMLTVCKQYGVERIIHPAGLSNPVYSITVPLQAIETNISLTAAVLETARLSNIQRVVLFSSECAYGDQGYNPCNLTSPLFPRTPYGVTKAATEMMGRAWNWTFGMECVSLRVAMVYGGLRLSPNCIKEAVEAYLDGRKYELHQGADQPINLIHIDDVVSVTVAACFANHINDLAVYNAFSHGALFSEILEIFTELMPGFEYDVGPGLRTERQIGWDISDTERDLNYTPKYTLREGLTRYIAFMKSEKSARDAAV